MTEASSARDDDHYYEYVTGSPLQGILRRRRLLKERVRHLSNSSRLLLTASRMENAALKAEITALRLAAQQEA